VDKSHFKVSSSLSSRYISYIEKSILCLISFGYRGPDDEVKGVQNYKADVREQLMGGGYSNWGILGDQYSSSEGLPRAKRTFKLPNPLYYVS
jgi:hypothetical protein